jgi:leucine dehydrogenase
MNQPDASLRGVFAQLSALGYGEVAFRNDESRGLRAILSLHDRRLGPALGGTRFIAYPGEHAALTDVLRLARAMTAKAALAGLAHGGGKAVVIRPPGEFDRTRLMRAFGRFVDELGGRYITTEDSGTSIEDMEIVRQQTRHVCGFDVSNGGSGDPSPFTALGVRRGIEACVKFRLGRDGLAGIRVAVQGVGNVGYHLCKELSAAGATLIIADVRDELAERAQGEFGAEIAKGATIHRSECDVFAPCALGGALNDRTIPELRCAIVAGAANNQLASDHNGAMLRARGILYAPDYAINAGGLVNVAAEVVGYDEKKSRARVLQIYDTIWEIAERAKAAMQPTYRIADTMVEERLAKA